MNTEYENGSPVLFDETRQKLKDVSRSLLNLHKILLDAAKLEYETTYGAINGVNQYLQLVIDDPHFAWLRKISSLIALIDEATSVRRPAGESEAQGLIIVAKKLLNFQDGDENFNDQLQNALQNNADAVLAHNIAFGLLK